jgi:hypothetical protein
MDKAVACKINKLEATSDTLTGRGGLAFFVHYIQAIGIVSLLLRQFAGIKKTVKGVAVENLFLQVLYFFLDGTSRHLCHFDQLQQDQGYGAVIEMPAKQMASSHAVKRFFRAFNIFHAAAFRWVLKELFVWRLRRSQPRQVILTLDTMCMDIVAYDCAESGYRATKRKKQGSGSDQTGAKLLKPPTLASRNT